MNEAKKTFLLPCDGCAHEIEIVAGQAGSRVECPRCQRLAEVPNFRELSRLRLKTPASSGRQRSWGMPQAVALAGLALAVLAWGTAAGLGSPPKSALNHDAIREIIQSNDDAALYKALEYYENADVARTAAPQEEWVQSRWQFLTGITRTLYALGGLGALAAAISGLTILMTTKDR